ncbi:MAG: hypothetical protein WCA15_07440 [Candidatus Acidiferrales bacterium]
MTPDDIQGAVEAIRISHTTDAAVKVLTDHLSIAAEQREKDRRRRRIQELLIELHSLLFDGSTAPLNSLY